MDLQEIAELDATHSACIIAALMPDGEKVKVEGNLSALDDVWVLRSTHVSGRVIVCTDPQHIADKLDQVKNVCVYGTAYYDKKTDRSYIEMSAILAKEKIYR